jgi:hypothetical protein
MNKGLLQKYNVILKYYALFIYLMKPFAAVPNLVRLSLSEERY